MTILSEIKTSLIVTVILLVICCGIYPAFVFGEGQLFFPNKANGSLVLDADGKPIASTLLGQTFAADKYFNPRPSSAGNGYDASSSSGSNLGPTSQALHDAVKQRVADYRKANNLPDTQPPGRRGGSLRQRPRPAHQREERAVPAPARGQGSQHERGGPAPAPRQVQPTAATSASSANPASTSSSSTSPSTGNINDACLTRKCAPCP